VAVPLDIEAQKVAEDDSGWFRVGNTTRSVSCRMKSIKDRSSFLLILLPIWLAAVFGVLKAEWISSICSRVCSTHSKRSATQKPIDACAEG
jgi:hypothetical protein